MAAVYADNNVSLNTMRRLARRGHVVATAKELGLDRARDHEHLLLAAKRHWVFATHDHHFEDLHRAWLLWSTAWGVTPVHAGIVIHPDEGVWLPQQAARELHKLLSAGMDLNNQCLTCRRDGNWTEL
jgi:hypothetical protein